MTLNDHLSARLPGVDRREAPAAFKPGDPALLDRPVRRVAALLLGLILLAIAIIVFWPGPPDSSGQQWLEVFLRRAHRHGLPFRISFDLIQTLANVAMFFPIGVLGALALKRHNYLVVVFAALGSGLIELSQLVLLPGRVASVEDVLSNTLGALLGLLVTIPALRRRRKRRQLYLLGRRRAADSTRRADRVARL